MAWTAAIYMAGESFKTNGGRDWRWWWPDWKGTSTGGSGPFNPNAADFYLKGSASAIVQLLGLDCYYAGWTFGESPSTYDVNWWEAMMARMSVLFNLGGAYPVAVGEAGYRAAQTGHFTSGSGSTGLGWVTGVLSDSLTQTCADNMLVTMKKWDVVGWDYWNNAGAVTNYKDNRLEFADPNRIRLNAIAAWMDDPAYHSVPVPFVS